MSAEERMEKGGGWVEGEEKARTQLQEGVTDLAELPVHAQVVSTEDVHGNAVATIPARQ
jgi:hypothetical protein